MASCTGSRDACTSNDNNEKPTRNEDHQEVCYETPTCKFDYCVKRPDYVAMQLTSAEANEKSVHAGGRYSCAFDMRGCSPL